MPRDLRILLRDMQTFIGRLERFSKGLTIDELRLDELRSSAIQHEFVLIAEVLKRMERISPEVKQRVERVREVTDFRNVIVHEYDHVDLGIVWDTAMNDIPLLKQQINAWTDELGMEPLPERTA